MTEAKAQVDRDPYGAARDYPAGPSEVLVIADATADPVFVAADLLSQAEHGADSQVLLVTTSAELASAVAAQVQSQKATLPRLGIVDGALRHSRAVVVADLAEAFELSNAYAPEHLILQVERPRDGCRELRAAGSVFLGSDARDRRRLLQRNEPRLPTYGFAGAIRASASAIFCVR